MQIDQYHFQHFDLGKSLSDQEFLNRKLQQTAREMKISTDKIVFYDTDSIGAAVLLMKVFKETHRKRAFLSSVRINNCSVFDKNTEHNATKFTFEDAFNGIDSKKLTMLFQTIATINNTDLTFFIDEDCVIKREPHFVFKLKQEYLTSFGAHRDEKNLHFKTMLNDLLLYFCIRSKVSINISAVSAFEWLTAENRMLQHCEKFEDPNMEKMKTNLF